MAGPWARPARPSRAAGSEITAPVDLVTARYRLIPVSRTKLYRDEILTDITVIRNSKTGHVRKIHILDQYASDATHYSTS